MQSLLNATATPASSLLATSRAAASSACRSQISDVYLRSLAAPCAHRRSRRIICRRREPRTRLPPAPGKRLVAWFVAHEAPPTTAELREHLRAFVPDYMIPSVFVPVERMPLTANGKLDQRALPEPGDHRAELAAAFVAPRSSAEEQLAAQRANAVTVRCLDILLRTVHISLRTGVCNWVSRTAGDPTFLANRCRNGRCGAATAG